MSSIKKNSFLEKYKDVIIMSEMKRHIFLEAHKDKPIENNQSYYYPKNPDDLMKPEKMKK
ncbi:hypothetical protein [Lactobacillus iners]|uniref:hypothetical protein n=1 Tax=Lactobacillus iners TaxID=147802 RepID=UPI003369DD68|nr:hypothetical protein [Lactobacillus iners]MCT7825317.1 hypothetical protein [Lactobacillus iners]MCT7836098.1 hypothetical protein [Lactobacillus iners]